MFEQFGAEKVQEQVVQRSLGKPQPTHPITP